MNDEQTSPPRSTRRPVTSSSSNGGTSSATEMLVNDLVAAVESGEFDLDDATSMDSTPFCRVCLNNNHKNSKFQQFKNIATFIRTRNRNFEYWRGRQKGGNEQPRQKNFYRQYSRTGRQSRKRSLSAKGSVTLSIGASSHNNDSNRYTVHSGPPPLNQTGLK